MRGNTQIIQELESFFRGANWNVIKIVWGRAWDKLLEADKDGALVHIMNTTSDGDYQTFKANDGAYVRKEFFGRDERTLKLVEEMTDDEIWALRRGGHDYRKIYAAYNNVMENKGSGKPTVILAFTIKGYGLGHNFEGRNATHQMKKLTLEDLEELPATSRTFQFLTKSWKRILTCLRTTTQAMMLQRLSTCWSVVKNSVASCQSVG